MKFHEFGDKNLPPILLIHGVAVLGGIIFVKHGSCQKNTVLFYLL
ncbi:hypothetical protein SIN_0504 [Streptococcus infantis SK1302]|uniref:Uncharacterized protein n=1 Tax=Streptococcus infantis SK1302 TaxID=871237 RepID=A0ABN0B6F1_9STRE|nr:hypothetical protein SIN_0504 [Streptococcus infantis SK1302]